MKLSSSRSGKCANLRVISSRKCFRPHLRLLVI
uniref:Uncharacterized protein n=1 Tax=Arundo donax TaxID=35708 RepID=A0A0A9G2G1_ARUDO